MCYLLFSTFSHIAVVKVKGNGGLNVACVIGEFEMPVGLDTTEVIDFLGAFPHFLQCDSRLSH